MAALFPRWSNAAIRAALGGLVLLAVGVPAALIVYMRTPYAYERRYQIDQPVEFDHRHHSGDDEIDCRYCHDTVEHSAFAGIPPTSRCMGCHAQIWNQTPTLEPVRRSWFSGQPIPWNRVHNLPDFVYFNHAVHVARGVGCATCHGRVDRMARVYQVAELSMRWCLDCHRDPTPNLRPPDRITDMEWRPPPGEQGARLRRELAARYQVRSLTHCTACHR